MSGAPSVVPDNPDEIVRRGQEAWSRLAAGRSWQDWIAVGEAIHIGRHRAMLEANTNRPHGSRFSSVFGKWLQEAGFVTLDKGARSRLLDCLEHRDEIEAWRQSLPANKRLELNHPSAVLRNWRKATVHKTARDPAPLSPFATLKREVVRLEEENAQLRRAGDDLFSAGDKATDIAQLFARLLLQRLSPDKARQVVGLLPEVIASRAELPRDAMSSAHPKKRRRTVEDFQRDLAAKRTARAQPSNQA